MMSSPVKSKNLCLTCWYYVHGKCVKGPENYCRITRSK